MCNERDLLPVMMQTKARDVGAVVENAAQVGVVEPVAVNQPSSFKNLVSNIGKIYLSSNDITVVFPEPGTSSFQHVTVKELQDLRVRTGWSNNSCELALLDLEQGTDC